MTALSYTAPSWQAGRMRAVPAPIFTSRLCVTRATFVKFAHPQIEGDA